MVAFQREEKPKTTSCLVMMLMVGCNGRGEEKWFGWEICLPVQGQCSTNPLVTSRLCLLSEFGKKSDSCPLLSTACAGRVRGAEPAPLFLSVGQHTPAISHSGSS
ncbi:centrosomal protein [Trichinella spiralis]|uniref:centrosomal protein n=1 Tax=Trichinella spiralis TaxID=6334 RepID=UPI0001EFCD18|nr:centrosomal protein [Trichinella spiralis]